VFFISSFFVPALSIPEKAGFFISGSRSQACHPAQGCALAQ
jgi:hypothetical protein